ncbi:Uncharacterised protein [Mycobacteroides abscessus subsp. abscessus]|nr:Uncharacterised protein [Mycobacteroides abscessus subsp. abscessus]
MPVITPVCVNVMSSLAREMPKSVSLTSPTLRPDSEMRMLPGLMSRCTMPAAWASVMASATCAPILADSVTSSVPAE